MDNIGTLEILKRYPVKSMAGEDLDAADVAFAGIVGDRVFAFVSPDKAADFPWHSAREQYDLLLYNPRFREPLPQNVPYPPRERFAVDVTTPGGATHGLEDPAFLDELQRHSGKRFSLRYSEKSMHDSRPISIFGLATLDRLGEEAGRTLDHRRFRANFYVRWTDATPFFEDALIGKTVKVGDEVELLIVKKDPRCIIITLDPDTATPHPEVLRTVARKHAGCAGIYAVVTKEGRVRRGDALRLVESPA
jgi:uncharacterized protein YcbX